LYQRDLSLPKFPAVFISQEDGGGNARHRARDTLSRFDQRFRRMAPYV
jgi:hypothetical protein